jgi:hypothetical protein
MIVKQKDMITETCQKVAGKLDTFIESTASTAYSVPVIFNNRFEKDLIKLENFLEYAESNSIEDAGKAIADICESNSISTNDIGFYVNESSMLSDDDVCDTAKFMMDNGYTVKVVAESSDSIWYKELTEAMQYDEDTPGYESSYSLQGYCGDYFNEGVKDAIESGKVKAIQFKDSSKEVLAKKYSAAKKLYHELGEKMSRTSGDAKAAAARQYAKAKATMQRLGEKLAAMKNKVTNKEGVNQ